MSSVFDRLTDAQARGLVKQVEAPFKNLPAMPEGLAKFFVAIAPWGALIGGVLSIFAAVMAVLGVLGIGALVASIDPTYVGPTGLGMALMLVGAIVMAVIGVIELKAFSPLRERKLSGWYMMFWVNVISLVYSAIGIVENPGSIVGAVIGAAIGFYILFKIKSYYTDDLA